MAAVIDTDVLVIGLGPAGANAARRASDGGAAVIALERRPVAGHPVQCAELVPALATQDSTLVRTATVQAVRRMLTHVEREAPDEQARFPGYMLDRARFDQLQVAAARAAGADCRLGTALRSLAADGEASTSAGDIIRARVIIGADGPLSRVGRVLGQVNRAMVHTRQVSVTLLQPHDATDIYLSTHMAGGYGWLFPKAGRANVGVGVVATQRGRLPALLAALLARLRAEERVGDPILALTGGAIAVGGMLRPHGRLGNRLALLAGDAAGLTNPVTGAGIHAAVVSGDLAGAAALAWLAGDGAADADYALELQDQFGSALARPLARRRQLRARFSASGALSAHDLRRHWIAHPDYWRADVTAGAPCEVCA